MPSETLVAQRFFPTPPAKLYGWFADPARLVEWWGPHGSKSKFTEFDLRPGGRWRLTMAGPWGEIAMLKEFVAVEPGHRILVKHDQDGHTFMLDMCYEAVPGGTLLRWETRFATQGQLEAVREAFTKGNEENLERLAIALGT